MNNIFVIIKIIISEEKNIVIFRTYCLLISFLVAAGVVFKQRTLPIHFICIVLYC